VKSTTVKSSDRVRLLELLEELSEHFPDMRLGQLVCNLAMAVRGADSSATWDVEDEELVDAARRMLSQQAVTTEN
jgi:hypothetical protein